MLSNRDDHCNTSYIVQTATCVMLYHALAMDLVDPHDCEICQHYPGVVCGSCGVKRKLDGVISYMAVTMVTCVGPTQTTIVMFQ